VNQITAPSIQEGITVLFEPPKKINISFYRCDNKYYLDEILDMYNNENLIGVCLMSGEELRVYTVSITGSHFEYKLVKKRNIKLPNKQKKGGQSAVRFARNADIVRHDYVIKYSEDIINSYMIDNNTKCNVTKIIVAGFGYMPNDVIDTPLFKQHLNKFLYKKLTINTLDDLTVQKIVKEECLNLSESIAKNIDCEISDLINNNSDMIGFGKEECFNLINSGNIVKLFVNTHEITREIKDFLINFPNLNIIESTSSQLELYGGWLCIKKYVNY